MSDSSVDSILSMILVTQEEEVIWCWFQAEGDTEIDAALE
jgi:hypothetical protein